MMAIPAAVKAILRQTWAGVAMIKPANTNSTLRPTHPRSNISDTPSVLEIILPNVKQLKPNRLRTTFTELAINSVRQYTPYS